MSRIFQAIQYITYRCKARGLFRLHSPFVFDFAQQVLYDRRNFYCYEEIEKLRAEIQASKEVLTEDDPGAGSSAGRTATGTVGGLAKVSSSPAPIGRLLFRTGLHYRCRNILELGTSVGLTTLYLSSVSRHARVISIEARKAVADIAAKNAAASGRNNIRFLKGTFRDQLPVALGEMPLPDLVYLDGHHTYEATLEYYSRLKPHLHDGSILVIGDIHWSKGMNRAWRRIRDESPATVSVDLYYVGFLFFRKGIARQDFVLKY